jgi:hypothetical protein
MLAGLNLSAAAGRNIVNGEERGIVLAEADLASIVLLNEDQKIAEQLEEEFLGRPPKTHPAWTGQAHGRGQRPSPRR